MASKNFSGVLRDPLGTLASNDKYRFTHVSTTGEVIRGSTSYLTIGDDGVYNIDIEYGNVSIESYSELGKRWIAQGTTTINSDTTVSTLPALLNALVPASDALILQLEALLADAESAATSAADSAVIATGAASSASTDADSASVNAAIATDAATSASASASSAASDAQDAVNAATSANTNATIATNAAASAESAASDAAASATSAEQSAIDAALSATDNTEVIKSILVAQGLSGEYGFFADGFTYVNEGDVCISTDNKIWIYVGAGAPNKIVAAGTVPSAPDYEQVVFQSAEKPVTIQGAPAPLYGIKYTSEDVRVISIIDGVLYADNATQLLSSENMGESWNVVQGSFTRWSKFVKTDDGEVLAINGGNQVFKSSGWSTNKSTMTFSVVVDLAQGGTSTAGILRWGLDGDGTKFIVNHYSAIDRADSRYAYISTNKGDTWAQVWDSASRFPSQNADTHLHAVCYDKYNDRFWMGEGHLDLGLFYSEDDGANWVRFDTPVTGPFKDSAPTTMTATPYGIVCGTDNAPNGIYTIRGKSSDELGAELLYIHRTGLTGTTLQCDAAVVDDATGMVYIAARGFASGSNAVIMASNGESAGLVFESDIRDSIVNLAISDGKLIAHQSGTSYRVIRGYVSQIGSRNDPLLNNGNALTKYVAPELSLAVGFDSQAKGVGATAIGTSSKANSIGGQDGLVVGRNNLIETGQKNIIVGTGSSHTGTTTACITIGSSVTLLDRAGCVTIGDNVSTNSNNTVSIGHSTSTTGSNSTAVGFGAKTTNGNSISLGYNSESALEGVAVGVGSGSGVGGVSLGYNSESAQEGVAVGIGSGSGVSGVAIGTGAIAMTGTVAIGGGSTTISSNSVAIGGGGTTAALESTSVGRASKATGSNSTAYGFNSQALGVNGCAIGTKSSAANVNNATAVGTEASAEGLNSTSIGKSAKSLHRDSVSIGHATTTQRVESVCVGDRDIESTRVGGGIYLKSPDDTLYKLTVADGGTLTVTAV